MTNAQLSIGILALLLSALAVSATVLGGSYWLGGQVETVKSLGAAFARARAEDTVRNDAILAVPELVRGLVPALVVRVALEAGRTGRRDERLGARAEW